MGGRLRCKKSKTVLVQNSEQVTIKDLTLKMPVSGRYNYYTQPI
jgi:hypothetical protein